VDGYISKLTAQMSDAQAAKLIADQYVIAIGGPEAALDSLRQQRASFDQLLAEVERHTDARYWLDQWQGINSYQLIEQTKTAAHRSAMQAVAAQREAQAEADHHEAERRWQQEVQVEQKREVARAANLTDSTIADETTWQTFSQRADFGGLLQQAVQALFPARDQDFERELVADYRGNPAIAARRGEEYAIEVNRQVLAWIAERREQ